MTDENKLPPLPTFMRTHIERAIKEAEQPQGMSVHDGMARVNVGYLRRLLALADEALTARPVADAGEADAYMVELSGGVAVSLHFQRFHANEKLRAWENAGTVVPLYRAAPSARTLPARLKAQKHFDTVEHECDSAYCAGWNACLDAILAATSAKEV